MYKTKEDLLIDAYTLIDEASLVDRERSKIKIAKANALIFLASQLSQGQSIIVRVR